MALLLCWKARFSIKSIFKSCFQGQFDFTGINLYVVHCTKRNSPLQDLYTKTFGRTAASRALTEPPYLVTRRNFAQCSDPISKLAYPRPRGFSAQDFDRFPHHGIEFHHCQLAGLCKLRFWVNYKMTSLVKKVSVRISL